MKGKKPITVRIGPKGHSMVESVEGLTFTHQDMPGEWHILENGEKYVLCRDTGSHLTFIEFYPHGQNGLAFYKGREWERRPRDDNNYMLTKPRRYYGMKMPLVFVQYIKNAIKNAREGSEKSNVM